jgi:dihydroxy-acid dehydratase
VVNALPAEPPRSLTTSAKPHARTAAVAVLRGSLAPSGAVIKRSAASEHLLRHVGPAVVFEGIADMHQRIDDKQLDVTPASVLVLRNAGPIGGPGMPEAGAIPIPRRLWTQGVRDMVRISDARMSGTAAGTIVLHVAPEAAVGGPLAHVRDGDLISLDVGAGRVDLLVDPGELAERSRRDTSPTPGREPHRGYLWLHQQHVMQANDGCDFDFLRARQNEPAPLHGGVV